MKSKRRAPRSLGEKMLALFAGIGSTVVELARFMAPSRSNQQDMQSSESEGSVIGCNRCGLIYEPNVFYHPKFPDAVVNHCPSCGGQELEVLGLLPEVFIEDDGFYMADEEFELGPLSLDDPCLKDNSYLWVWFNMKKESADEEDSEDGEENQVIEFQPQRGIPRFRH